MSSKQISFNLHLKVDGKESVVTAVTTTKELQNALAGAKTNADKFKESIFRFNQVTAVWTNVSNAVSGLNTALSSLASSYQNVEVANTRLKTVMQERMNASYLT